MCLDIKYQQAVLITKKLITCYKVVIARKRGRRKLQIISPFYDYVFTLNALHTTDLNVKHIEVDNGSIVEEGFHSFTDKAGAQHLIKYLKKTDAELKPGIEKYEIVSCVIPPGSKYYLGNFLVVKISSLGGVSYVRMPSIASNKIIPERII